MRSVKFLLAAGAASMLSTAVLAADMPSIMPPPPMMYAPVPVAQQDFGGWYLRGDIGMTTSTAKLHTDLYDTLPGNAVLRQLGQGFTGGTSFGVGVGYQVNSWFRIDATGEYRSRVGFSGTDFVLYGPGNGLGDAYTGGYTSWVGLINVYADLGTWYCITPFVGVGVGAANIKTTGLADVATFPSGSGNSSSYFAEGASRTNGAYALPRRPRLQGQQQLHRRTCLPVSRHGHRGARHRQLLRRHQGRPVHIPVSRYRLAGLAAWRALQSRQRAGLRAAAAGAGADAPRLIDARSTRNFLTARSFRAVLFCGNLHATTIG